MRRCKLHLLCCVATLIFAAVPVAIMLPLAAYLDPSFLARLDAAALAVVRRLPRAVVGAIGAADDVWSEGDSDDSDDSDDSAGSGRHAFRVGQVFKHKVKRYTGAITRLTPAGERGEHGLGTGDVWYSALIDQQSELNFIAAVSAGRSGKKLLNADADATVYEPEFASAPCHFSIPNQHAD